MVNRYSSLKQELETERSFLIQLNAACLAHCPLSSLNLQRLAVNGTVFVCDPNFDRIWFKDVNIWPGPKPRGNSWIEFGIILHIYSKCTAYAPASVTSLDNGAWWEWHVSSQSSNRQSHVWFPSGSLKQHKPSLSLSLPPHCVSLSLARHRWQYFNREETEELFFSPWPLLVCSSPLTHCT